jgi:hypothetical protein
MTFLIAETAGRGNYIPPPCGHHRNEEKQMSVEHFNDIEKKIRELGCVASLVVIEATKISRDVFKDAEFYPSVLQVLTHLVAQQLNISDVQEHYEQDEVRRRVNREIDAALSAQRK